MNYKKFTLSFILIIILFVTFNFLTWNLATKHILSRNDDYITGDMARMGYITNIIHKRKNLTNLPKKHFEIKDYNFEKIDMITIGDSFSNGAGGGLNRYYQDYIATYNNLNILNINSYKKENEINTILTLLNSGFLNKIGVRYILLESTQRKVVDRFSSNIKLNIKETINNIEKYYNFGKNIKSQSSLKIPEVSFINNGNFKYLIYNLLYNFSNNAYISKVYIEHTYKDLFSIKPYNKFLFYKKDLTSIHKNSEKNLQEVNTNLNKLDAKLKKQNIELIFMPVVNKFDLYHDYIISNKYPNDPFFKIFKNLKKNYIYVDTKTILSKELNKGVKDLFFCDDLHWSYKASDVIAKHLLLGK
jgi:hypothetical protein